jgi:hypothetical protein
VARVDVAVLIVDPSIRIKIGRKDPPLTEDEVREVALYAREAETRWDDNEEHGLRLIVRGRTYAGRPLIAYLLPANLNDPEEGTFILKTAMAQLRD